MSWTGLKFGKHKGKTLPQVVLSDPDWFFWAVEEIIRYGRLADEAAEVAAKARHIKIPKSHPERWSIEYRFDDEYKFQSFSVVKLESPEWGRYSRQKYLDLAWIRQSKAYDKRRSRMLIKDFRYWYVGRNRRMTAQWCEDFFDNDDNFVDFRDE